MNVSQGAGIDWSRGLIAAIVQDADSSDVLMVGYMNEDAYQQTLRTRLVTFYSRSREKIWVKGETSGNFIDFVSLKVDCDGDALLIQARPRGPVCHTGTDTCFGERSEKVLTGAASHRASPAVELPFLLALEGIIDERMRTPSEGSYVSRLIARGSDRILQKVGEEAVETVIAGMKRNKQEFVSESADLLFHLLIALRQLGLSLKDVEQVLKTRHEENAAQK